MPKNKKRYASRGNILIKIKKMINENDEKFGSPSIGLAELNSWSE